jgi:hypothetical protein
MKVGIIVAISMLFSFSPNPPSDFKYTKLPNKYIQVVNEAMTKRIAYLDSLKNPYQLEKSLPSNFVKDGSIDYTDSLQKAINTHGDIIFPDFPVLVNQKGLTLKSNTKVYFPENSQLIMQPNGERSYEILAIKNAHHVKVYYPNVVGDKTKHFGNKGEWCFGISIKQSNDIIIESPVINYCQGDGIYIGGGGKPSQDVTINNALVDNSGRNGLSITSGINIKINSCVFSNTNGMGPGAGIDIEPNNINNEIQNINIDSTVTFNNENWGLLINLVNLRKGGDSLKNVGIDISNHTDDRSDYGMGMWVTRKGKNEKSLNGNINIVNCKWLNNRKEAYNYFENDENKNNVNVSFQKIKVYNKNDSNTVDQAQIQSIKRKYSNNARYKFSD